MRRESILPRSQVGLRRIVVLLAATVTAAAPLKAQVAIRVDSVSPTVHPLEGGTRVRVNGNALVLRARDPVEVFVGDEPVAVDWPLPDVLSGVLPPMPEGVYDIRVRRSDGASVTVREAVRFAPMKLSPVESLSCRYDSEAGTVRLEWALPIAYDSIDVLRGGRVVRTLAGDRTSVTLLEGGPAARAYGIVGRRGTLSSHAAVCLAGTPDCAPQFVPLRNTAPGPISVPLRGAGADATRVRFTATEPAPLGLRLEAYCERVGEGQLLATIRTGEPEPTILVEAVPLSPTTTSLLLGRTWLRGDTPVPLSEPGEYVLELSVEGGDPQEESFRVFQQDLPPTAIDSTQMLAYQLGAAMLPERSEDGLEPDETLPLDLLARVTPLRSESRVEIARVDVELLHPDSFPSHFFDDSTVHFTALLVSRNGDTVTPVLGASYFWSFGDGQYATTSSPTIGHRYYRVGSYTVRLIVTDFACEPHQVEFLMSSEHFRDPPPPEGARISRVTPDPADVDIVALPDGGRVLGEGPIVPVRFLATPELGDTIESAWWTVLDPVDSRLVRSAPARPVDPSDAGPSTYWQADVLFDGRYRGSRALLRLTVEDDDGDRASASVEFRLCKPPHLFEMPELFEDIVLAYDSESREHTLRGRMRRDLTRLLENDAVFDVTALGPMTFENRVQATVDVGLRLRERHWYIDDVGAHVGTRLLSQPGPEHRLTLPLSELGEVAFDCGNVALGASSDDLPAIPFTLFGPLSLFETRVGGRNVVIQMSGAVSVQADWSLASFDFGRTTSLELSVDAHATANARGEYFRTFGDGFGSLHILGGGSFAVDASYAMSALNSPPDLSRESCVSADVWASVTACEFWGLSCQTITPPIIDDETSPPGCEVDAGFGAGGDEEIAASPRRPSLATSPDGSETILVWESPGEEDDITSLVHARVEDGAALRPEAVARDIRARSHPRIAFLSDDLAVLVCVESRLSRAELLELARDGVLDADTLNRLASSSEISYAFWMRGDGWSEFQLLTNDRFPDGPPRVAADLVDGSALVVWERAEVERFHDEELRPSGSAKQLFSARIRPDAERPRIVPVTRLDARTVEHSPTVAVSPDGNAACLVWIRGLDGGDGTDDRVAWSRLEGGSWSEPRLIGSRSILAPSMPSIALANGGRGLLALTQPIPPTGDARVEDSLASGIYVVPLFDGAFGEPRPLFHPPANGRRGPQPALGRWPQASLLANGSFLVGYRDLGGPSTRGISGDVAAAIVHVADGGPPLTSYARRWTSDDASDRELIFAGDGDDSIVVARVTDGAPEAARNLEVSRHLVGPDVEVASAFLRNAQALPGAALEVVVRLRNAGLGTIRPRIGIPDVGGPPEPLPNVALRVVSAPEGGGEPHELHASLVIFAGPPDTVAEFRLPIAAPQDGHVLSIEAHLPGDIVPENDFLSGSPGLHVGVAPPSGLACSVIDVSALAAEARVGLSWRNEAGYDHVAVHRGGLLVALLAGSATSFVDAHAPVGRLRYSVVGRALGSASEPEEAECELEVEPPPPADGIFSRGDANADGGADISDAVSTLGFLFLGATEPPCRKAADANDDGGLDITDAIYTLGHLFLGGPPPPPPASCGADPTADALDCQSYEPCAPAGG